MPVSSSAAASSRAPSVDGIKLHIGGWEKHPGWFILDALPGPFVDYVGNCRGLSFLSDNGCSEVYASHVLEHLGYNGEFQKALKEIYRVLKPGGRLRASVPDLETPLSVIPAAVTQLCGPISCHAYDVRWPHHRL
jgi:predicted SAM-dependent methyltransferase